MRSLASEEFNMMMQRRMSQENPIQATESEFAQRLQRLTLLAVNRLIYLGRISFWFILMKNEFLHLECWSVREESCSIDTSLMDLAIKHCSLWFVSQYYVTGNLVMFLSEWTEQVVLFLHKSIHVLTAWIITWRFNCQREHLLSSNEVFLWNGYFG